MRGWAWAGFALLFAGCSGVLGIEDFHGPRLIGDLRDIGLDSPVAANVVVTLYRNPDPAHGDAPRIGETTADGHGHFELPVTAELPFEGYLEIVDSRDVDSRNVHSISVIQSVLGDQPTFVSVLTATAKGLQALAVHASEMQGAQNWLVIAQVVDSEGSSLLGATVHAEVADPPEPIRQICYSVETDGLPCRADGGTGTDGHAWLFDVPENLPLNITAVDAGSHRYAASFPIPAGPGVLLIPVPPSS